MYLQVRTQVSQTERTLCEREYTIILLSCNYCKFVSTEQFSFSYFLAHLSQRKKQKNKNKKPTHFSSKDFGFGWLSGGQAELLRKRKRIWEREREKKKEPWMEIWRGGGHPKHQEQHLQPPNTPSARVTVTSHLKRAGQSRSAG